MKYIYSKEAKERERELYEFLQQIRRCPGVLIGPPSLNSLFHFIGGYTYAVMQLTQFRFHFDIVKNSQLKYPVGRHVKNNTASWAVNAVVNSSTQAIKKIRNQAWSRILALFKKR